MSHRVWGHVILICLVVVIFMGFWLRASQLDQYPPGISNDEAVNTIDAFHILRTGNFPLYQDQGRPDPFFRLIQAFGAGLHGSSIWAFRLTSAFVGTITLASAYWATTQSLYDVPLHIRKLAGLIAVVSLAVALGHISVTRSTYRAVPQPLFMFLMFGFLMRGLRIYRWHDFFLSGVFIALGLYTYTAAFVVPIAFFPLGLSLLIFRRHAWRKWLPRLVFTGVVVGVLTLPIATVLLDTPEAIIGRATTVSEGGPDLSRKLQLMMEQFFTRGDENPQYNVADAPLVPTMFAPVFLVGFAGLIARIRQPSTSIITGLFILTAIPVIATDEITHGLRVVGEFAVFPLIVGVALAFMLTLAELIFHNSKIVYVVLPLLIVAGGIQVISAKLTYVNYWEQAGTHWRLWFQYDRDLTHSEWFFRTDRRALAEWITTQGAPLLIPLDELEVPTTRAWLLSNYGSVRGDTDFVELPDNIRVLLPWSLERGDFRDNRRQFVFLDNGTMSLLPPLSRESFEVVLDASVSGELIPFPDSNIDVIGKVFDLPEDFVLSFEQPVTSSGEDQALAVFNDELIIANWRGSTTISGTDELEIYVDWRALRAIGHEYGAYVQLLAQDWDRIAGDEHLISRWLYPTSIWQTSDTVSDRFHLKLPDELHSGAYRLIAGVYFTNGGDVPAQSYVGETTNNRATIGWIKVPQQHVPIPSDQAIEFDIVLNDQFRLDFVDLVQTQKDKLNVKLYWHSLVERPDIDATIFVHAVDENGIIVSQSDIRPHNGQYPTFIWGDGELVVTEHELEIVTTTDISLIAGMYTQPDFTRLTATSANTPLEDNLIQIGRLNALLK